MQTTGGDITLQSRGNVSTQAITTQGGSISIISSESGITTNGNTLDTTNGANNGAPISMIANGDILTGNLNSYSASSSVTVGSGGEICLTTSNGILGENSDITANAFTGNGGNMTITTNGIYGLRFQPKLTPLSDITASSQFGLSGTVTLNLLTGIPVAG